MIAMGCDPPAIPIDVVALPLRTTLPLAMMTFGALVPYCAPRGFAASEFPSGPSALPVALLPFRTADKPDMEVVAECVWAGI